MKMLSIHIQGLSLCHFNDDRLAVAMANSNRNPSLKIPTHLQTLVLPKNAVDASNTSADTYRVKLAGRVRPDLEDTTNWGWDLEGVEVSIGPGRKAPTRKKPSNNALHPDPKTPDWTDMRWVMDIKRFSMGSILFPDVLEVSHHPRGYTRAIAKLTGGSVTGAPPQLQNRDCNHIWQFSPQYEQAVTDSMLYVLRQDGDITITLRKDDTSATITVNADAIGHLMNEATPGDIGEEKKSSSGMARHASAYFELCQHMFGAPATPTRGVQFRDHDKVKFLVEGVFCIILTYGADQS